MAYLTVRGNLLLVLSVTAIFLAPSHIVDAAAPYSRPLDEPTHVTSTIGEYRPGHLHEGIDFSTNYRTGEPVQAIDSGRVSRVFHDPKKYGKTVVIRHDDGKRSWYSHLEKLDESIVSKIKDPLKRFSDIRPENTIPVERGEVIGYSGRSGSGPPHLHLAIQKDDGSFINPIEHFQPELPFEVQPRIGSVQLFPLSGDALINGEHGRIYLHTSPGNPIQLWGELGIDVVVWNEHRNSSSRSMPESIILKQNGRVIKKWDFSTVGKERQEEAMRETYYENYTNLSPTQFTVHLTPSGEDGLWEGVKLRDRGIEGQFTVRVTSVTGQSVERTIPYRVVPPAKSVNWFNRNQLNNDSDVVSVRVQRSDNNRFTKVTLMNHQLALTQYSPPRFEEFDRAPSVELDVEWLFERLNITAKIDGQWRGWPKLTVSSKKGKNYPTLYQVAPGKFEGWWIPSVSDRGWQDVRVMVRGANKSYSKTRRVYFQQFRSGNPGAIASMDGQYTLYQSGEGLNFYSGVRIDSVEREMPLREELELIGRPRFISPEYLQSTKPMTLRVGLPDETDRLRGIGIYKYNPVSGKWTPRSFKQGINSRSLKAEVFGGGYFALIKDVREPEVSLKKMNADRGLISFTIKENGSGISRDDVEIVNDSGKSVARWNSITETVTVSLNELESSRTIRLRVTDRAGNEALWEGTISGTP